MDEQVEILRAIWNEMKGLNGRVNATNAQLEQTTARLELNSARLEQRIDQTNARLEKGFGELRAEMVGIRGDLDRVHRGSVDRDIRLGTAITELGRDVRELTHLAHDWRDEHRLDRAAPHGRVERLERHVGIDPR
jgi:hypothetical protein